MDRAEDIESYLRDNRFTFPVVMSERDGPGVVGAYRIETYPSSYVINSESKIIYRAVGVDEEGLLRSLRELGFRPRVHEKPKN